MFRSINVISVYEKCLVVKIKKELLFMVLNHIFVLPTLSYRDFLGILLFTCCLIMIVVPCVPKGTVKLVAEGHQRHVNYIYYD